MSICPFVQLSISLSVHSSVCHFLQFSICAYVCQPFSLSNQFIYICPSIHLPICLSMELLLKGKVQYSWPPCTNLFRWALFYKEDIIYLFYKTSYLKEEVNCTEPYPSVSVPDLSVHPSICMSVHVSICVYCLFIQSIFNYIYASRLFVQCKA
jgi:hypothetical protein